jgi:hypothetical protein
MFIMSKFYDIMPKTDEGRGEALASVDPHPPSSTRGKTGKNHLNEENTPLLPTGIDERFS